MSVYQPNNNYVFSVFDENGVMVISSQPVYYEHDDAILMCTSFGGPVNSFQWLKDGENYTELVTVENNTNTLTIYDVHALIHGGVYACAVNNSAGDASASVSLNIAPQFSQSPQDISARVEVTVEMVCVAVAYPEPTYQWEEVNGNLLVNVTGVNTTTLTFPSVTYEDGGSYSCVATSNGIPIATSAFLIGELVIMWESMCHLITFSRKGLSSDWVTKHLYRHYDNTVFSLPSSVTGRWCYNIT